MSVPNFNQWGQTRNTHPSELGKGLGGLPVCAHGGFNGSFILLKQALRASKLRREIGLRRCSSSARCWLPRRNWKGGGARVELPQQRLIFVANLLVARILLVTAPKVYSRERLCGNPLCVGQMLGPSRCSCRGCSWGRSGCRPWRRYRRRCCY